MKSAKEMLSVISYSVSKGGVLIAELALVSLMILTVYAVITRYAFRSPSVHALEISQYLLLVISWLSIGWVLVVGRHVRMEAGYNAFPKKLQKIADIISRASIVLFCIIIIWAGSVNAITALEKGYRSSSLLSFPMWMPYTLIPLGGGLLLVATLYLSLKVKK